MWWRWRKKHRDRRAANHHNDVVSRESMDRRNAVIERLVKRAEDELVLKLQPQVRR